MNEVKKILAGGAVLAAGAGAMLYSKYKKTIPKGVEAVKHFDISKFMGKWYEIARLDYMFEKHMNYSTAEYSLNKNGSVKVVNRGYNYKKQKEEVAVGKVVFAGEKDEAMLKVSFQKPFYSGYNVIAIDSKYKYALVTGRNRNYLWLLSKEREMPEKIMISFLQKAEELGYDTSKLIWTSYK